MAINISGILKAPQGSAIQNAEIIFEQTRTSTEVLAGTKFSVITNQTGNYSSSLGVGTYVFKVRFQDETQYRTVASNVIVTQSMNNYTLNQIIQNQSQLEDVDYDLLQDVIQARDQAAVSAQAAQTSQATATTKASEASSSAQAALASKNAAQTSEANALSSKNAAQTSQTNAANSQTAAATSQTTATTKATEASNSAQAALTSKNAAQTSEANALASKTQAQASQTNAANSQAAAAGSQTTATTKAGEASTNQTNAANSQTAAATKAGEASTSQSSSSASQATATTKAGEASTSQSNAAISQSTATTKASEASASSTLAQKWAANPENSIVSGGLYSALHYAAKAQQSAQTAQGQLVWRGGWSAQQGTTPPTPSGATQDFYRITQAGTILGVTYDIGDYIHWDNINSIWFKMDGTDSVISVNGRQGAVVINKDDVGLSSVNNWGASSQVNDPSTTTYATTAAVKAAYDLAATKLTATANAVSASKLLTARTINGTSFDGTTNIVTGTWGTQRNITVGLTSKSVNGAQDQQWTLQEIGALPLAGGSLTGNVSSSATFRTSINQSLGFVMQRPGTTSQVGVGQGAEGTAVLGYGTETVLSAYIKIGPNTAVVDIGQGVKNLYHEGNKPTAADVGALPITGGTLTGSLTLSTDANRFNSNELTTVSKQILYAKDTAIYFGNPNLSEAYLETRGSGKVRANIGGTKYDIYHEGFKPTAADVGAATHQDIADSSVPFPDVWIPFNDSLRMLAGYGDDIKVGGYTVATQASFSRASTATYIDKSGVLRTAAINEPRFEKEGLLIEGQSTNILSKWAGLGYWAGSDGVIEADEPDPFGAVGEVISILSKMPNNIYKKISVQPTTIYTFSIYYKVKGSPPSCAVLFGFESVGIAGGPARVMIDCLTGALISLDKGVLHWKSTKLAGGWNRLEVAARTSASATSVNLHISEATENIGNSLMIFGWQAEALPFATSGIPTNGAAATRAGDFCSIGATGNYTGYATYAASISNARETGTGPGRIIWADATSVSLEGARINADGELALFLGDADYKLVFGSYVNGFSGVLAFQRGGVCRSGDVLKTSPNAPLPSVTPTSIKFGYWTNSNPIAKMHIRNFRIWHTALTDAQIKGLK